MARPVGGKDYPRTRQEFRSFFPDEVACLEYLTRLRWPDGFHCPSCGCDGWRSTRGRWTCRGCGRQTSLTAGTIFEGTRKPLLDWFEVAWRITNAKNGVSALTVSGEWGVSRETGWMWLHKFRRAMVRPDRDMLSGRVEVDETFLGGAEDGVRGRQTIRKAIVVVAVELLPGDQFGRARLAYVKDASAASLHPFVHANIKAGSTLVTDFWPGYLGLDVRGYTHERINIKASDQTGSELLPGVHLVASLLDRWWLGTHHGAIRHRHLNAYLDEFVFRFNRRGSRARGLLFYRLLEGSIATEPTPFGLIVGGNRQRSQSGTE
jgi:transposase-like protein